MSDPFARHGIDHLSPSSLNCYTAQPAFWALKYLHGFKDDAGASAWRGKAVEAGLDYWLYKRDSEAALKAAMDAFELDAAGLADDATDKEREVIQPMLNLACAALSYRPAPVARQLKIEVYLDGIEVPVIGYIDYLWADGLTDLKTTSRMPSEIPGAHACQVALYCHARGVPGDLLYVTKARAESRQVEDCEQALKRLTRAAHSLRALLSMYRDRGDAARVFAPDFDHFYWKPAAIEAAQSIWG